MSSPLPTASPGEAGRSSLEKRRGFLTVLGAVVCGGIVALVPLLSGLWVFLDPLRRKNSARKLIRVATLHALPDDGVPRRFPVVAERDDAWNHSRQAIGAVFLRRKPGEATPSCLTATCPHAGCFVDFDDRSQTFKCPCHNSSFRIDGAVIEPSPSPRAMDSLACQVDAQDVLVQFESFYSGRAEKVVKE